LGDLHPARMYLHCTQQGTRRGKQLIIKCLIAQRIPQKSPWEKQKRRQQQGTREEATTPLEGRAYQRLRKVCRPTITGRRYLAPDSSSLVMHIAVGSEAILRRCERRRRQRRHPDRNHNVITATHRAEARQQTGGCHLSSTISPSATNPRSHVSRHGATTGVNSSEHFACLACAHFVLPAFNLALTQQAADAIGRKGGACLHGLLWAADENTADPFGEMSFFRH
jgi:hypothetical protein